MDFLELIEKRYSVRAYKPDVVEPEKLEKIFRAAQLAPTAANRQPVHVIVVETAGHKEELRKIYRQEWFSDAPYVLCVCGMKSQGWTRKHDAKSHIDVDASIVMDHIVLAATALGLGTCWIAAFDPDATREVLGIPLGVDPIVFTPLGYAADEPRDKKRKPTEDIIKYHQW